MIGLFSEQMGILGGLILSEIPFFISGKSKINSLGEYND